MAIDTHMHINSAILSNIEHQYIDKIVYNDSIEKVINVGLNLKTSKESIKISKYSKFYSSVGIHPTYINNQNCDDIYQLITDKVVAIGEIGLDKTIDNYDEQKQYLLKQLMIANELHLPVIIHSNNTNKEIIELFERYIKPKYGCVFHCFQPDFEALEYIIDNGYYISFAGKITYANAKKSIEIAKLVPNEFFLIETDSPYFTPQPIYERLNETANIKYIIDKLSQIKDLSHNEIEKITTENAKRLFKKLNRR